MKSAEPYLNFNGNTEEAFNFFKSGEVLSAFLLLLHIKNVFENEQDQNSSDS
jgi:hypothetical protein